MKSNKMYEYRGPVYEYERCIENYWEATTWAISEKRARNNLAHRYKRDILRGKQTKIELPGEFRLVE